MRNLDLDRRLERLIKLKEESVRIAFLSTVEKGKEARMGSLVAGVTPESHHSSYFINPRHDFRFRKRQLPTFDGTNPEGWIMEAERYFNVHRLTNKEKLEAAVVSFEGEALRWHGREEKIRTIAHWEAMKILLLKEFRSSHMGTHLGQWFTRKQEGIVRERVFELRSPLHNRSNGVASRKPESRGKPETWANIQALEPNNMGRVMDQAQELKERNVGVDSRSQKKSATEERKDEKLLAKVKSWKDEERAARAGFGLPAVSVRESSFGGNFGGGESGSGGGGSGSKGFFGLFKVAGASRNDGSSIPTASISKSGSGEYSGVINGSSDGGGGGSRGNIDFLGIVGGSRTGRSSSSAGSASKSGCGRNSGGGGGGSDGGLTFSGGDDSSYSGGSMRSFFRTWENFLLGTKEQPHREGETEKSLERNPKTPRLTAMLSSTEPLVLLRPLLDIVGACLQIGMVEIFGRGNAMERKL